MYPRRKFLEMVGAGGGAAAVYDTLVAMGVLATPEAAFAGPPDTSGAPGAGKSVIVLGAGVAGLVAAYRFRLAKYSVTVIEASNRLGGRNFTVSTASGENRNVIVEDGSRQQCAFVGKASEQYFEAGAGRIPYHHIALLELCRELKIALEPYVVETRANRFQNPDAFSGKPIENRRIANDTRGHIASLLAKAIANGALADELAGLDQNALLKLLVKFGDLQSNFDMKKSTRSGFLTDPGVNDPGIQPETITLAELLKSAFWEHRFYQPEDYLWQDTLFQPKGGMRRIVDTVADAFRNVPSAPLGRIITNVPVREIRNTGNKITVIAGTTRFVADYCFSTIPLPLLSPLLKDGFAKDFRAAVEVVKFANTCKVGWQAKRRFWEDLRPDQAARSRGRKNGPQIFGGISWIDHPITQVWYPSDGFFSKGPAILTGAYNYDPVAKEFGTWSPHRRLESARQGLALLHPGSERDLMTGISIAWQRVPFIGGGWAEWNRMNTEHARAYNRLLKPDKGFYVGGDQVSYLPGWMEGAVLSAYYVVDHVIEPALYTAEKLQVLPAPDTASSVGSH